MSNQGEEEKDTLLGADSDFGCESFEHQSAQTSLYTRLSVCKTLLTFLFLTATFSFIAVLVLLSKYYVLANDHALLETEYTTLETQIVSLKNHIHIESSPYAGLIREISSTYYEKTDYNNAEHQDQADVLWDSIDFNAGIIALSDNFVEQKGLPVAQRFPWDPTKGIYLINGHHHLHCLKSIYNTIKEFRRGLPQSRPASHVSHCLDALRRQIICDADDTPRATTREFSPNSGVGQSRQCRSWDKLERWAANHTACYRYIDPTNTTMSNLERFKFCPEGSPYWNTIREAYPDAGS